MVPKSGPHPDTQELCNTLAATNTLALAPDKPRWWPQMRSRHLHFQSIPGGSVLGLLFPSLLVALWGSRTISGETFDGISMSFTVSVAQKQTPNSAQAVGGRLWITLDQALGPRGRGWWLSISPLPASLHLMGKGSHTLL